MFLAVRKSTMIALIPDIQFAVQVSLCKHNRPVLTSQQNELQSKTYLLKIKKLRKSRNPNRSKCKLRPHDKLQALKKCTGIIWINK